MATSIYGNMTPYPRHFHVFFDVASCLLNPSTNAVSTRRSDSSSDIQKRFLFHFSERSHAWNRVAYDKMKQVKLCTILVAVFLTQMTSVNGQQGKWPFPEHSGLYKTLYYLLFVFFIFYYVSLA